MAKSKSNGLMPTLAGVFCFFVVFLQCLGIMDAAAWRLNMLLTPALWLLLGLCLLARRQNWIVLLGMFPLTFLEARGAWAPLPTGSSYLFVNAVLCDVFPALALVVLFLCVLLTCLHIGGSFRRDVWLLPVLLMVPCCIWQHDSTLPWAQLGAVACMTLWYKPARK